MNELGKNAPLGNPSMPTDLSLSSELERVEASLNLLDDSIDRMQARLDLVLTPDATNEALCKEPVCQERSVLLTKAEAINRRIQDLNSCLCRIADRVQV